MLDLTHVTKSYGDIIATDDVSLQVEEGELFSIVGPSGAGKSTVLHAVAGLEFLDEGTITIDSEEATDLPPYERDTATVFQSHALFPHMTVKENIAYGLKQDGVSKAEIDEKVEEYLELVELSGYEDRSIGELSGGEQQRVALVRSLIKDPKVLLLDEPLSSLDQQLRVQLRDELQDLQRELNQTSIYVTHDQNVALSISDRIAIMNDGKVEQVGTPHELYNEPETEFVSQFIGSSNSISGRVTEIRDEYSVVDTSGFEIVGRPNNGVRKDDEVNCVMKLEDVRITMNGEQGSADNHVTGVVKNQVYRGRDVSVVVETDDGRTIEALTADTNRYEEGDSVELSWSADDCVIFSE